MTTVPWLDRLGGRARNHASLCMLDIFKRSERLYEESRPVDSRMPIGAAGEEAAQKGEALAAFLRHIRAGHTPNDAAIKAKADMVAIVEAHNRRRPCDVNWRRHVNAYDGLINDAAYQLIKATALKEVL